MKTFTPIDEITSVFSGQSDVVVGVEDPTYSSATLDDLFGEGAKSLGQIVEDSTSWDGDDPSMDPLRDEQGDTITTRITAGTLAFSLDIASTSTDLLKIMGCFSGCLMSSASIQKLFCGIYSGFKCSFDEFVGEKVVSPSYSSAIF